MTSLEDAYLMARYFTKTYEKEDAEEFVRLVEDVMKIVEDTGGIGREDQDG